VGQDIKKRPGVQKKGYFTQLDKDNREYSGHDTGLSGQYRTFISHE